MAGPPGRWYNDFPATRGQDPVPAMTTFGDDLRHEREIRGIALEEIVQATKIPKRYLEAIEKNDLEELPGGAFNKGFIRAYARSIGADPELLVEAYLREEQARNRDAPAPEPKLIQEMSRLLDLKNQQRAGWSFRSLPASVRALAALSFLASVAIAGWLLLRGPGTDPSAQGASPPPRAAATPAVSGTIPRPDSETPPPEVSPPVTRRRPSPPVQAATRTPAGPSPATEASPEPTAPTLSDRAGPPPPPSLPDHTVRPRTPRPLLPAAPSHLLVAGAGVGTGVIDHELVGRGGRFPEGARVCFWTRATGGRAGDVLHHVWIHEGRPAATIVLKIGGPHWRTYSKKTLFPGSAGHWRVEARDARGRVLASEEFICSANDGGPGPGRMPESMPRAVSPGTVLFSRR